jgi:GcrA cell cycle regulator
MKSHRPRQRMASKRLAKSRYATIGNPALRALYNAETNVYLPPTEELVIPIAERKSIQTLTEVTCRWPIGDPQNTEFHFCGKNKVPGLPYCEVHARRAFQPPQSRRRDRAVAEPVQAALAPATESKEPAQSG